MKLINPSACAPSDPLPSAQWRASVNRLAYWMFLGVVGLFWIAFIALMVHLGVT
jgi:hypothetical protein